MKDQIEKQAIKEMANDLQKAEHWQYDEVSCTAELDEHKTATNLYNAGYRKQTEGEWGDFGKTFYCSVCKKVDWYKSSYCPNCGARMKGENK